MEEVRFEVVEELAVDEGGSLVELVNDDAVEVGGVEFFKVGELAEGNIVTLKAGSASNGAGKLRAVRRFALSAGSAATPNRFGRSDAWFHWRHGRGEIAAEALSKVTPPHGGED